MQCKSLWIKASAKCVNVNVMFTHQDAEMHPLSVTGGKELPINLIKIDHTLRNIYCLDQSLYIQLKSKVYTHLAESAKC